MTERSLIIIDELCRSTSLEEGMALAMAICEKLAKSSSFLYITTHFTTLSKIYEMYLNVKVWQMETSVFGDTPQNMTLVFKYNLVPGVTQIEYYGIYLIRNIWPDYVINLIEETLMNVKTIFKTNVNTLSIDDPIRMKYEIESKFRNLKAQGKLTNAVINKYLNEYQNRLDKRTSSAILSNNIPQFFFNRLFDTDNSEKFNINISGQEVPRAEDNIYYENADNNLSNHIPQSLLDPNNSKNIDTNISTQELPRFEDNIYDKDDPNNLIDICRATGNKITEIFTPDQYAESVGTASPNYKNISSFMNENPEYLHLFEPEVHLSIRESVYQYSNNTKEEENGLHKTSRNEENNSLENLDVSENTSEFKFAIPLLRDLTKTSTPHNKKQIQIDPKLLQEEMEICSQVFSKCEDSSEMTEGEATEEGDNFSKENNLPTFDNHSNIEDYKSANQYQNYLSPKVVIVEGPNNKSISIEECDTSDSEALKHIVKCNEKNIPNNRFISNEETETVFKTPPINNRSSDNDSSLSKSNVEHSGASYCGTETNDSSSENKSNKNVYLKTDSSSGYNIEIIHNKEQFDSSTTWDKEFNPSSTNKTDSTMSKFVKTVHSVSKLEKNQIPSEIPSPEGSLKTPININCANNSQTINNTHTFNQTMEEHKFETPKISESAFTPLFQTKTRSVRSKFKAPRKMTTKQIRAEFSEQDKKLLDPSIFNTPQHSKYLHQYVNRPSIKQVQNQTRLATIRKTGQGIEVISEVQDYQKFGNKPLCGQERPSSSDGFDVTIFSDLNAKSFEEFLNSKGNNTKMFNFEKKSNPTIFGEFGGDVFQKFDSNGPVIKSNQCDFTQNSNRNISSTSSKRSFSPKKEEIDRIMAKYLPSDDRASSNIFQSNIDDFNFS